MSEKNVRKKISVKYISGYMAMEHGCYYASLKPQPEPEFSKAQINKAGSVNLLITENDYLLILKSGNPSLLVTY